MGSDSRPAGDRPYSDERRPPRERGFSDSRPLGGRPSGGTFRPQGGRPYGDARPPRSRPYGEDSRPPRSRPYDDESRPPRQPYRENARPPRERPYGGDFRSRGYDDESRPPRGRPYADTRPQGGRPYGGESRPPRPSRPFNTYRDDDRRRDTRSASRPLPPRAPYPPRSREQRPFGARDTGPVRGERFGRPDSARFEQAVDAAEERLQKYLARSGVASRRHAEELIEQGEVTVNGEVVDELGARVTPGRDEVRVRGRLVRPASEMTYVLLNKPAGVVTTASDPEGRQTVLDVLPRQFRRQRIYPVGRLDYDTEGLLLLTDDGDLAQRLTHPSFGLLKEYHALVEGQPTPETLQRLERGVLLPGELRPTAPARAWIIREMPGAGAWVGVEIHEGRNRQVRRMLDAVGHHALRLRRVRVGPLSLNKLREGDARALTSEEVAALRSIVGLVDEDTDDELGAVAGTGEAPVIDREDGAGVATAEPATGGAGDSTGDTDESVESAGGEFAVDAPDAVADAGEPEASAGTEGAGERMDVEPDGDM